MRGRGRRHERTLRATVHAYRRGADLSIFFSTRGTHRVHVTERESERVGGREKSRGGGRFFYQHSRCRDDSRRLNPALVAQAHGQTFSFFSGAIA